jgi:hypothetical protein
MPRRPVASRDGPPRKAQQAGRGRGPHTVRKRGARYLASRPEGQGPAEGQGQLFGQSPGRETGLRPGHPHRPARLAGAPGGLIGPTEWRRRRLEYRRSWCAGSHFRIANAVNREERALWPGDDIALRIAVDRLGVQSHCLFGAANGHWPTYVEVGRIARLPKGPRPLRPAVWSAAVPAGR